MNRILFFNSVVITASLALLAYSVIQTLHDRWSEGNYFLILAFGLFSFLHYKKR
jgi:hypothetical protein